jgi:hypothetical protein
LFHGYLSGLTCPRVRQPIAPRWPTIPASLRRSLRPCGDTAPAGERWVHEIKFDGYRVQVHIREGKPAAFTRSGLNWTSKFSTIAAAAVSLPVNHCVMDGEIVVQDDKGHSRFGDLQANISDGRTARTLGLARMGRKRPSASLRPRENLRAGNKPKGPAGTGGAFAFVWTWVRSTTPPHMEEWVLRV